MIFPARKRRMIFCHEFFSTFLVGPKAAYLATPGAWGGLQLWDKLHQPSGGTAAGDGTAGVGGALLPPPDLNEPLSIQE